MRGLTFIGIVIVCLIIGFLVIKNMGGDHSDGTTEAQKYREKAEDAVDKTKEKINKIRDRIKESE